MKRIIKISIAIVLVAFAVVVYQNYPRLNIISGYSAKNMASSVFLANRTEMYTKDHDNNFSPVNVASQKVNYTTKKVTSSVFGLMPRTAVYVEGLGSVLLTNEKEEITLVAPNRNTTRVELPYPYGDLEPKDSVFAEVDYSQLKAALNNAFDTTGTDSKKTRAVVVLYKDHLLAEQYLDGFTSDSKILGWSMSKSITSAVLGVLHKQQKISLTQNSLFNEWENDQRKEITLQNLLHMNSGLEWDENYDTMSDVTRMLFMSEDMAKYQKQKPLTGKPNESWNYSSGTSNLLSGFIRDQFSTQQAYVDFWYSELIDKIGMKSMVIESDLAGNFVGSSYAWATPRDWAKFGLLYLHNGNWNGAQIINQDWVDFTKTPTNGSNGSYGGHFWLNAGGVYPDVPKDLFSCNGFQGQYVFIIPSKELVIVRMGLAEDPDFNVNTFLKEVIAAIKQ